MTGGRDGTRGRWLGVLGVITIIGLGALAALLGAPAGASAQASDSWRLTLGSMGTARRHATVTRLQDGRVLVVGGVNTPGADFSGSTFYATAELYDPATETFSPTGTLTTGPRALHTATLLPNGKVLIAGGWNGSTSLSTAEVYDPGTGMFTATGPMGQIR